MGNNHNPTVKTLLQCLAVTLLALAVLGWVLMLFWSFSRPVPWVLGLLLGGACSAAKILLMERSMAKSLDMARQDAANYGRLHSLLRFFLTLGMVLLTVALRQWVSLIGMFAGVIALQPAAYATHLVERHREKSSPPRPAAPAAEAPPEDHPALPDEDEEEEDEFHSLVL